PVFCGMSGSYSAMRTGRIAAMQRTAIAGECITGERLCDVWSLRHWPALPTCAPLARVPIKRPWIEPLGPSLAERRAAGSPAAARRRLRVGTGASAALARRKQLVQAGCGRTDGQERTAHVTTMSSAEPTRRDFLYIATASVAGIGAAATLVPLIAQMNPDASTIAAGAPIEVDLSPIADGQ